MTGQHGLEFLESVDSVVKTPDTVAKLTTTFISALSQVSALGTVATKRPHGLRHYSATLRRLKPALL